MNPSAGSGFVDVLPDPDKNGIFKISNTESQVFEIICKKGENRVSRTYSLNGLVLERGKALIEPKGKKVEKTEETDETPKKAKSETVAKRKGSKK